MNNILFVYKSHSSCYVHANWKSFYWLILIQQAAVRMPILQRSPMRTGIEQKYTHIQGEETPVVHLSLHQFR